MGEPQKFGFCRLIAHQDTGRIRWCVGQEDKWKETLKRISIIPLVMIPLLILIVCITKYAANSTPSDNNTGFNLTDEDVKGKTIIKRSIDPNIEYDLNPNKQHNNMFNIPHYFQRNNNNIKYNLFKNLHPNTPKFRYFMRKKRILRLIKRADFHVNSTSQMEYSKSLYSKTHEASDEALLYEKSARDYWFWNNRKNISDIRTFQSKIMKTYMNPAVDPCNNFYEFSCGNWKKYYSVPPDKATYDTFEIVRERLDYLLRELLHNDDEQPSSKSTYESNKTYTYNDSTIQKSKDAITKAKNLYKSCMQTDIINKKSGKPLKSILHELGGWPIVTPSWKVDDFDIISVLSKLRLLNNDILISHWIGPDMKNSNKYIVYMNQASLGLPSREYFLEKTNFKYVKAYKSFILSVAKLLGSNPDTASEDVEKIIEFETKLAEIMVPTGERNNISDAYLRITVESMSIYFPKFNWKSYFTNVLGKHVDIKTPVSCYCTKYLQQLLTLLQSTDKRTIQNYLLWRFIRHRTSNLDEKFMDAKQKFYYSLFGYEKQPMRWQFCVAQTNLHMGMALGALFVQNFFDQTSKTDTTEITENILETFRKSFVEKTWLDNHTKNLAKLKINSMDLKIGFPDFILNELALSDWYDDIEIDPNNFFGNILNVLRHLTRQEQKRVGLQVNKTVWNTPPAVVNAYYSRNKNQIMFPAGILQPPFYHKNFPKALNFGGIGVVIGHEITHGFDDIGRLFDHKGNLHLWWDELSITKFQEKSRCMIDQYNGYTMPEIKLSINGMLTQGENIADNGGLRQAFRAYKNWLEKNPEADETLPDIELNGPQLFFLNFAQVWCGQQRSETTKNRLKTSVHSPGIFRVIGALSNSQEFAEVFNCPKNSPMNPDFKCELW